MGIRLAEIDRKKVVPTKESKNKVYFQDVDNLYPNRIKGLIENSPTAFRSADLMAKFIVGKGLVNENLYDIIVDKVSNLDVYDFSLGLAKQIAYQRGYFVHVAYKYDTKTSKIIPAESRIIPFEDARISRSDDDGYLGKLIVKDWEQGSLFSNKSNKQREYYTFTRNQDYIKEQLIDNWKQERKDEEFDLQEAIRIFKGQYYYYNPCIGDVYPLAYIHPVQNDCDTEYRIGDYTNRSFREGLLGKVVVMTNGLTEEDEDEVENVFKKFLGSENSSGMVLYPVTLGDGQNFEDALKVVQLKPQYDEKFISETVPRLRRSIMAMFNSINEALVTSSDSSLFGTSGDSLEVLKKSYSDQNDPERKGVQKFWKEVYDLDVDFITFGSETSDIVDEQVIIEE